MKEYTVKDMAPIIQRFEAGPHDPLARIEFLGSLEGILEEGHERGYAFAAFVPEWNLAVFRRRPSDEDCV